MYVGVITGFLHTMLLMWLPAWSCVQAMATLMAALPMESRQRLLTNASLADQFVSSHLVLGTSLGSKALEALLPAGQLRTAQGNLLVTSSTE